MSLTHHKPFRRLQQPKPLAEVIHLRPRESEFEGEWKALRTPEDWRRFSQFVYGDDRLAPSRDDNVVTLPLPRQRSTREEILQVRAEEVCRGTPRKVL